MYLLVVISQVSEEYIEEMFSYVDNDVDDNRTYTEFKTMVHPPKPPRPTLADLVRKTQTQESQETDKMKPKEEQTTTVTDNTENMLCPVTTIHVANILIHNASAKDAQLKGPKPMKEKGGKKG